MFFIKNSNRGASVSSFRPDRATWTAMNDSNEVTEPPGRHGSASGIRGRAALGVAYRIMVQLGCDLQCPPCVELFQQAHSHHRCLHLQVDLVREQTMAHQYKYCKEWEGADKHEGCRQHQTELGGSHGTNQVAPMAPQEQN